MSGKAFPKRCSNTGEMTGGFKGGKKNPKTFGQRTSGTLTGGMGIFRNKMLFLRR
jgi:hypothetical protein